MPRLSRFLPAAGLLAVLAFLSPLRAQTYDVLIRGGRVLDGTGTPWIAADVAISGDRIVAVGRLPNATAKQVVDARGLFVAPGFIDGHTHAGPALAQAKTASAEPLLQQGVTTVFVNPDGGGPTDMLAQRKALTAHGLGVNVAQLIGHNSLRSEILGSEDRTPNAEELTRMGVVVRRAFEAGAFGLSAGPFYVPGTFSKTEEHIALARIAAEFDGFYTSHVRDEADYNVGVVAAMDEVIRVAREARLPGIITHIKVLGPRVWGLSGEIIKRVEAARAEGVEVFADQYPYEASSTGLTAALVPAWAQAGGAGPLKARLTNPEQRAQIRREMLENLERRAGASNIQIRSHRANPKLEGRRLDAIARERVVEPADAAIEIILAGGASIVSFNMDERDIRAFMVQPWTMTCSDGELVAPGEGVPHPRSYGPYPRKLRRYVVEEKVLTLERAIHSMTGLPAAVFRVRDRGAIRPGALADVVVFDLAAVRDRATYEQPHQLSEGMRHVFVNGLAALSDGRLTESRAGRVLTRVRP
ncbi:MAG TPA: amidohydrolase family protein [Opitutaceae bacterium]|nr:amidohydrolase family protein [Opitutaceae bacterium]